MRINIQKIEIHNFMSFGDETFDFASQNGMNLVTGKNFDVANGKNGAGKSTLFSALLYGLYGQLATKLKSEYIANKFIDDKEVRVVVYLDLDEINYKSITGLNKRAQGYFNLFRIEDGKEIDITKSSIAETRDYFENQLMHCDISLFLRTVLLTSEQDYNFFNLKKQNKKEFIEKLFDIGIFGDMYAKIHKDVLLEDKKIVSHQNQMLILNQNIEDYKLRIDQFDSKKISDIQNLNDQIQTASEELQSVMKENVQKNTSLIQKYQDALNKLYDAKLKVNNSINEQNMKIQKMQFSVTSSLKTSSDRKKVIDKHSELFSRLCDDCKPIFDQYHNLSQYKKEMQEADSNVKTLNESIETQKNSTQQLKDKLTQIDQKIQKAQQTISNLNQEYDKSKNKQSQIENKLSVLKSSLQQVKDKVNPYIELLEDASSKMNKEKTLLDNILDNYKYLKKSEEIVSQESLKKFIIKDLVGLINNRIKTYLAKMGSLFTCIFDENLDYEFMTERGNYEFQNFSCGEKKRLEIATCLSFRDFIAQRSNIQSNIMIVDEYIDSGIDTLAVESILSILKEYTVQNMQNIFIISHRTEVNNDIFNRTIELQKKNGISTIHII